MKIAKENVVHVLIEVENEISMVDAIKNQIAIIEVNNKLSIFEMYEEKKPKKITKKCRLLAGPHEFKERILQIKFFDDKMHVFVFSTTYEYKIYVTNLPRLAFKVVYSISAQSQEIRSFVPMENGYYLGGDGLFFINLHTNEFKTICKQERLQNG